MTKTNQLDRIIYQFAKYTLVVKTLVDDTLTSFIKDPMFRGSFEDTMEFFFAVEIPLVSWIDKHLKLPLIPSLCFSIPECQ